MFKENEYSMCCDWFEGTCWPRLPADLFVWELCDKVFDRSADDIAEWSGRGWQGYSNRCTIGGKDKLVTLYFRKGHCFERMPVQLADDMTYGVAHIDDYGELHGEFYDVHIVVTGSGLRFLGNDGATRLMQFFAVDGVNAKEDLLPRFAYDFVPTRIDIAFDVFADNGFIDLVNDALLCEYNHACLENYKGKNRVSCNSKVRTLIGHMQEGSLNWTWGSRGTSNFYFRLYDKCLEQECKNGPLKGQHDYWWRMEYECRMCAALNVARCLIYDNSIQQAVSYCVENFMCIVEDRYNVDCAKSANPIAEFWADFCRFVYVECGTYKRQYVVEPYTIIHLVQSKRLRCKQDILLSYIANPYAFQDDEGMVLLERLRSDPRYKSLMLSLDSGILSISDYSEIMSLPVTRGVSSYWDIQF